MQLSQSDIMEILEAINTDIAALSVVLGGIISDGLPDDKMEHVVHRLTEFVSDQPNNIVQGILDMVEKRSGLQ